MLEVTNDKSVTTCFNISIFDSFSTEENQVVVEINGKKYFALSVHIQNNWTSDSTDYRIEMLNRPCGELRLVSVLKNGKSGNDYKTQIMYRNSFDGLFAYVFDAYDQALKSRLQSEQLVGAN